MHKCQVLTQCHYNLLPQAAHNTISSPPLQAVLFSSPMPASLPDCPISSRYSTWDKAFAQNGLVSSHDCAMFPTHRNDRHHESSSHSSEGEHSVCHRTLHSGGTDMLDGIPARTTNTPDHAHHARRIHTIVRSLRIVVMSS